MTDYYKLFYNEATRLFTEFFESEKTSGIILMFCTTTSLIIANSPLSQYYAGLWQQQIGFGPVSYSIHHWINDGLMAIFFLLVGLEIERELYAGELSEIKNALLPISAAIGGVLLPALIHLSFNIGLETQAGFGIPMATDIAFAVGVLSLAAKNVPLSLKVFLTALAIVDDLVAVIMIALFYTKTIQIVYMTSSLSIFAALIVMNRLRIHVFLPYLILGTIMWYLMHLSGVHATIAGVLLAFAVPFGSGSDDSPSYKLQHMLHKPVAFFIMPLFALANTGIVLTEGWYKTLADKNSIGIILGLLIGKPIGILTFSFIAVKTHLARLPVDIHWGHISAAGMIAGIGFTMSIFISALAFDAEMLVVNSKIAILVASATSAVLGLLVLKRLR